MYTEPTAPTEMDLSIESIKEIMDGFDPASLLPDLGEVFQGVVTACRVAVLVGPLLLLALGLVYLFLTPKEANHHIGYRCYFGMGSVQAWRFTQRLAGIIFGSIGLILSAVMFFMSKSFTAMTPERVVFTAAKYLLWQGGFAILANIAVPLTAAIVFDRKGEYRASKRK